jgi:hypothetical protein
MQKRRTRGNSDTAGKTTSTQRKASSKRTNAANPARESGSAAQRYTQHTRMVISNAWEAMARAVTARGRRLLDRLKNVSLQVTAPLPKKYRIGAG